jgi:hypothetical protein
VLRKKTSRILFTTAFGFALTCTATVMAKPPEARLTIEHSFAPDEGKWPSLEATLVKGRGHKIYGVLGSGGPHENGTAYSFNTNNGHFKVLHSFTPDELSDRVPSAIVVDSDGAVW